MKRKLHTLGLALSTFVCATVFLPWARERETVSGLMGRWWAYEEGNWKGWVGEHAGRIIGFVHGERLHCLITVSNEEDLRKRWYGLPN